MRKGLLILFFCFLGLVALFIFSSSFPGKLEAQDLEEESYFGDNSPSSELSIPKDWGQLRGVSSHDQSDTLYFQTSDGTIQVVRVVLITRSGKHFFKKIAEAKISRK
ncbi:MAG: hypothetical protein K9L86_01630 [Candidatus Omnitrophica bacterium]|nr:hypothetical protein [Candidatus Omnitrophota bacterium]